jgi:hypothetical protein
MIKDIVNSKPVESLTNFFSEIVGKPLIDGAGILYADAIRTKRIENSLKLEKKYNLKNSKDSEPTSLNFGYKLLEKASLEEDDYILEKWADLLANATDKNFKNGIRRIFIDILEKLEPYDVKRFDDINKFCLNSSDKYNAQIKLTNPNVKDSETLNVLLSLGLITYGVTVNQGIKMGGLPATTFHGLESFKMTELGQSFYKSVTR